jgi:hypothetical protein
MYCRRFGLKSQEMVNRRIRKGMAFRCHAITLQSCCEKEGDEAWERASLPPSWPHKDRPRDDASVSERPVYISAVA